MPVDVQHERLCSGTGHRSGGRKGKNLGSLLKEIAGMVDKKLALFRIFTLKQTYGSFSGFSLPLEVSKY